MAIGYVLRTYGARYVKDIRTAKAAEMQLSNLECFLTRNGRALDQVFGDYARDIQGPESLPVLFRLLDIAQRDGGLIVIDDLQRVFSKTPISSRKAMLDALVPFNRHLLEVRHEKLLVSFTIDDARRTVAAEDIPLRLVKKDRPGNDREKTRKANRISALARRHRSIRKAEELLELKNELESGSASVSMAQLASAANARGIMTTTGKDWTKGTIWAALKRAADDEKAKTATE